MGCWRRTANPALLAPLPQVLYRPMVTSEHQVSFLQLPHRALRYWGPASCCCLLVPVAAFCCCWVAASVAATAAVTNRMDTVAIRGSAATLTRCAFLLCSTVSQIPACAIVACRQLWQDLKDRQNGGSLAIANCH